MWELFPGVPTDLLSLVSAAVPLAAGFAVIYTLSKQELS